MNAELTASQMTCIILQKGKGCAMDTFGNAFNPEDFNFPTPCVLTCVHCMHNIGNKSGRLLQKSWVLDYSINLCGKCKVGRENETWLPRTPGIGHLYPPGVSYWEDSCGVPCRPVSAYIIFEGGEQTGFTRLCENARGFARLLDRNGELGKLLDGMAWKAAKYGDKAFNAVMSDFFKIANLLCEGRRLESGFEFLLEESEAGAGDFAEEVQSLIAGSLDTPLRLKPLAERLGISVSSLSHKYREASGETPTQTQIRLRMNLAKSLLLKGSSVKEAASRSGFYDEFHFSRVFKRLHGQCPSAYAHRPGMEKRPRLI